MPLLEKQDNFHSTLPAGVLLVSVALSGKCASPWILVSYSVALGELLVEGLRQKVAVGGCV